MRVCRYCESLVGTLEYKCKMCGAPINLERDRQIEDDNIETVRLYADNICILQYKLQTQEMLSSISSLNEERNRRCKQ